jgi:hypothetical protein
MINISLDVERALEDAVKWHHGQFRKRSPLPYVTHVIEVMKKVYTYIHDSKSDRHMIDMLIASPNQMERLFKTSMNGLKGSKIRATSQLLSR